MEEVVVRRPTAPPTAMAEQVQHLIELTAEDQHTILVLPMEAGLAGYWGLNAPFSLYTYEDPQDPDVVAVELDTEDRVSIEEADIERYDEMYRRARRAALSAKNSVAFLKKAMANSPRCTDSPPVATWAPVHTEGTMRTTVASPAHNQLFERIDSLLTLTILAEGELHRTVYRAHLDGVPEAELVRCAELKDGEFATIIQSFERLDAEERANILAEPYLSWCDDGGINSYG